MLKLILLTVLFGTFQSSNKRVLELYVADAHNPVYLQQLKALNADAPGLKERDVVIVKYFLTEANKAKFKSKGINEKFTSILIGKDGGEKFRSDKVISLQKLYGLIDAMPMRQEEMKRKSGY